MNQRDENFKSCGSEKKIGLDSQSDGGFLQARLICCRGESWGRQKSLVKEADLTDVNARIYVFPAPDSEQDFRVEAIVELFEMSRNGLC